MKTTIIDPLQLDPAAVVPQCLDTHYISDDVMAFMLKNGYDYAHPEVINMRRNEAHREYRRSLLYSRQTIINRAFFFNPLIFEDFEDAKGNDSSRLSFKRLIEEDAIIPFLQDMKDILSDAEAGNIKVSDRSHRAVESLDEIISELNCVRLAIDDAENRKKKDMLAQAFRVFCQGLGGIRQSPELLNLLATEVFKRPMEQSELEAFGNSLHEITLFSAHADILNRTVLYDKFLCQEGAPNHEGKFRTRRENPFMLEQKKVFDLSYNSNLPDLLDVFLMTPLGLPTRSILDVVVPKGGRGGDRGEMLLEELRRPLVNAIMSRMQNTYYLPHLANLTIEDICALRDLPEWTEFVDAQEKIVTEPEKCLHFLEKFADKIAAFQKAFSEWYYRKYQQAERENRYGVIVGVTLNIAARTFAAATVDQLPLIVRIGMANAPDIIPRRVKGFVARLMVAVIDAATGIPDPSLSYSLDLIKSNTEMAKEDVLNLLKTFGEVKSTSANSGAPDQQN